MVKKNKSFCDAEDFDLLNAWLYASKNSERGSNQKSQAFWEQIEQKFNTNGNTNNRDIKALKNCWFSNLDVLCMILGLLGLRYE